MVFTWGLRSSSKLTGCWKNSFPHGHKTESLSFLLTFTEAPVSAPRSCLQLLAMWSPPAIYTQRFFCVIFCSVTSQKKKKKKNISQLFKQSLGQVQGDFPCSLVGKKSACNAGDMGSIPGSGRSPGEGHGNPLQYSCLENPMDRGACGLKSTGLQESDMT